MSPWKSIVVLSFKGAYDVISVTMAYRDFFFFKFLVTTKINRMRIYTNF